MSKIFEDFDRNITFKEEDKSHEDFLFSLYSSTREDEFLFSDMSDIEKKKFLRQQFQAKESHYKKEFNDAQFLIMYKKKKAIGRYIYRRNEFMHLIDIALIKKQRGMGYGSKMTMYMTNKAKNEGLPVMFNVELRNTRALKLYQKLGFKVVSQKEHFCRMELHHEA